MSDHNEGNGAVDAADGPDAPQRRPDNDAGNAHPEAFARVQPPPPELPKKPPLYKRPVFWIVLLVIVAGGLAGGILYWLHTRDWEETDDAFIQADVTQVSPRVAGHVLGVYVTDNQNVKQGEKLVDLDPADFQARVDESQAAVVAAEKQQAQAKDMVTSAEADVGAAQASEKAAQTESDRAHDELKRYESLSPGARIQQQLINYQAAANSADANLAAARQRTRSALAHVKSAQSQVQVAEAQVKQAQASLAAAKLQLSYTQIFAPLNGYVTNKSVNLGDFVQVGQALMALVPGDPAVGGPNYKPGLFVIANFKETQLDRMKVGQEVEFTVDAYPGHTFHGQVDSIQRGSGAAFSLLPPENATGNYVKVVQRVPVKITFNGTDGFGLGPGMSVVPRVKVR
ncbi:MAG TPA: HlyD family secretion protein [Tepidisphaeraceae bacterium]|jgi:membrane fusion protein (multidrug efflux system)